MILKIYRHNQENTTFETRMSHFRRITNVRENLRSKKQDNNAV